MPVARQGVRCTESWPAYYLDQVRFEGLSPDDDDAARAAVARHLGGERVSLGIEGTGPRLVRSALAELYAVRELEPRLTVLEEGAVLRLRVTLSPR